MVTSESGFTLPEEPVDPGRPVVDPHHHLWPEPPHGFPRYELSDLVADARHAGHNVAATVVVQAHARHRASGPEEMRPVGESDLVAATAREASSLGLPGLCSRFVAHADMARGERIDAVLDAHAEAFGGLCGIRHQAAFDEEIPLIPWKDGPELLASQALRDALKCLGRRALTFDFFVVQSQLEEVARVAAAVPDTQLVLDHLGTPMTRGRFAGEDGFAHWRAGMARLASLPNLTVKLGGLNMAFTGLGLGKGDAPWTSRMMADMHRRHVLTAIDLFGADRCMFESNFPVDRMMVGPTVMWNAFKRIVADFSEVEKDRLFAGTAVQVYRVDWPIATMP